MTGGHPCVGLERLLQLPQRHPGHVGKFEQIDGVFRRIRRPLPYAFHDHPLFGAPLKSSAIKAGVSVVENEQTVFEQLLCQRIFIKQINSLRHLRESRA